MCPVLYSCPLRDSNRAQPDTIDGCYITGSGEAQRGMRGPKIMYDGRA